MTNAVRNGGRQQAPMEPRARRVRLMIVDDVPDTAQNILKMLRFEQAVQVVGVAASGQEAIARAPQYRPDVVLMDIHLRDMDGLKVAEMIARDTGAGIVIMSVQTEPEYFRRAFAIGARDYLIKPFSSEELMTAVMRACPPTPTGDRGTPGTPGGAGLRKIIAVYSPKGGTGRSVIAANLAIALRQSTQQSVLLLDANLQSGDAHILLNLNGSSSIDDLREAGALDQELVQGAVQRHAASGIGLLRAPLGPESAELFSAEIMKAILNEVRDQYDYVVVDTDSTFSEATLNVLEMADEILVVTTLEVPAINRVSQFLEVAERLGYPKQKLRLVCNRVDAYYGIRPQQVEARLRTRFVSQIPEDTRLVVSAVNRGVPFVLSQKSAPISRALQTLAERVVEMTTAGPSDEQARDKPWWRFF